MTAQVSIVVTTYNVEKYIERAVASALAQNDVNVEVIIVDDASTDNTWNIICGLNDARITHKIQLPQNGGPSIARNAGIAVASGDWIAVLDGDDTYDSNRLKSCLAVAQKINADVVVDNLTVVREEDGKRFVMFTEKSLGNNPILDLAHFISGNINFLGGNSLGYLKPVFSASFLRQHSLAYDNEIRIGEDYLLLAEVLACGARCAIEPTAGYLYTVRKGSISHRLKPEDVQRIALCDKKFLSRHTLDNGADKAQKIRSSRIQEAYAFTLLVDALKRRSIRDTIKAIMISPTAPRHLWQAVWVRVKRVFS